MIRYEHPHIFCGTHDFKNNISRFMGLLESGAFKAVMVERRGVVVGCYVCYGAALGESQRARARSPQEEQKNHFF